MAAIDRLPDDHAMTNGAAAAAASSAFVSQLHLAREQIRADDAAEECKAGLMYDTAEAWEAYAERLRIWRFDTLRGNRPNNLQQCRCGRVQQLEPGLVRCFSCGHWFTALNS